MQYEFLAAFVATLLVFSCGCLSTVFRLVWSLGYTRKLKLGYFLPQFLMNYVTATVFFFTLLMALNGNDDKVWWQMNVVATGVFVIGTALMLRVAYRPSQQTFQIASYIGGCVDFAGPTIVLLYEHWDNYSIKYAAVFLSVLPWIFAVRAMERSHVEPEIESDKGMNQVVYPLEKKHVLKEVLCAK